MFNTRQDLTEWAIEQVNKYGIRQPETYTEQEIKDAVEQGGESVKKDGIAIVVANNGSIIRRGVGTVPWRQMVEQLNETVNPTEEKKSTGPPLPWMD